MNRTIWAPDTFTASEEDEPIMNNRSLQPANSALENTIVVRNIHGDEIPMVDARALHAFLGVGKVFAAWIKERIETFDFTELVDFRIMAAPQPSSKDFFPNSEKTKMGRPSLEYLLTLDMAKELCMVERNARGKEARQYFIAMEKKARGLPVPVIEEEPPLPPIPQIAIPKTLSEALSLAADLARENEAAIRILEEQDEVISELAPKAKFYDQVGRSNDTVTLQEFAKSSQLCGPQQIFNILRQKKIIFSEGRTTLPYQDYINRGYFHVKETPYELRGETRISFQIRLTSKGQQWLFHLLSQEKAS